MTADELACREDIRRRRELRDRGLTGLDFLEVSADGRSLAVFFVNRPPRDITRRQLRIEGGRRDRQLTVTGVRLQRPRDPAVDECLVVTLDRPGDPSCYVLRVVGRDDIDPRFAALEFTFAAECAVEVDCLPVPCPPTTVPEPELDYLAKDYAGFRRLILDRLALVMPEWRERHVPDLGIALAEVLAYVGDQLSYRQDAVATEAYLDTARRRTSIRRHARLVDYALHDGCNARAWVHVETSQDLTLPPGVRFETDGGVIFLPLRADEPMPVRAARNRISFYTWGLRECCLPAGATAATLLDDAAHPLALGPGDALILEEVLGPRTGQAADADPAHRHVVVLTRVRPVDDPVTRRRVLEVRWGADDALPFPLCLSAVVAPECRYLDDISVARGNVVLVDHGRWAGPVSLTAVAPAPPAARCAGEDEPTDPATPQARFAGRLPEVPLTFAHPVVFRRQRGGWVAARELGTQDAHRAVPAVDLREQPPRGGRLIAWEPRSDLLGSGPADPHFVVETDDDGGAEIRIGDGVLGRRPPADSVLTARYRVGNGPAGVVAAETITRVVMPAERLDGVTVRVRNPLPTIGGTAPETPSAAKLAIPNAFRRELRRAVTDDDYARIAQRDPRVQRAQGRLRWSGSWYEAQVAIDPIGGTEAAGGMLEEIDGALRPYRRIGHDLRVTPAVQVPLDVALTVCVRPHHLQGHVRAALLDVLSNRSLPGGRRGLFHPDALTFGSAIHLSRLIAAAQAVEGVESVTVTTFQRLFAPAQGELATGLIRMGPREVPRLDNDPTSPEHGRLTLDMGGGR